MADETKPPSSQELLVQMFLQLNTEFAHARADVSVHVLGLYETLVRLGFATRKKSTTILGHRQMGSTIQPKGRGQGAAQCHGRHVPR
jgi:hypothetical protein